MKLDLHAEFIIQEKLYASPMASAISVEIEDMFATSNLEPIVGGDDPDIDW